METGRGGTSYYDFLYALYLLFGGVVVEAGPTEDNVSNSGGILLLLLFLQLLLLLVIVVVDLVEVVVWSCSSILA